MANPKIETRISGSVKNPEQFPAIIEALEGCKFYAYIFHDCDQYAADDDLVKQGKANIGDFKPRHIHFYAEDRHALRVWSKLLDIPENMIEIPRNFRSVLRYLVHKDDPQKFQYPASKVITNMPFRFKSMLEDNQELKPSELFNDLRQLRQHLISTEDFVEKYQFWIYKQSFLSQYKILTDLICNYD